MSTWLAIGGAAVATYLTRALPLAVAFEPRGRVRRYLEDLPTSIIAALAGAGALAPDQRIALGAELVAAPLVIAVAWWRRNLLFAVIAGVVVVAILRRIVP